MKTWFIYKIKIERVVDHMFLVVTVDVDGRVLLGSHFVEQVNPIGRHIVLCINLS